jgi:hypothetical protein
LNDEADDEVILSQDPMLLEKAKGTIKDLNSRLMKYEEETGRLGQLIQELLRYQRKYTRFDTFEKPEAVAEDLSDYNSSGSECGSDSFVSGDFPKRRYGPAEEGSLMDDGGHHAKRYRRSCDFCTTTKIRCDGTKPTCQNCAKRR